MAESKFDGYMNVFLGHGTRRWDPFWHTRYKGPGYGIASTWGEFDDLFTHNGVAKKIIKAPADEAMRAGFTLKDGDVELDQNDAVQSLLEDLNVEQKISTALKRLRDVPTVGGVAPVDANGDMRQPVSLFSLDGRTWKRIHETAGTRLPQESAPELR